MIDGTHKKSWEGERERGRRSASPDHKTKQSVRLAIFICLWPICTFLSTQHRTGKGVCFVWIKGEQIWQQQWENDELDFFSTSFLEQNKIQKLQDTKSGELFYYKKRGILLSRKTSKISFRQIFNGFYCEMESRVDYLSDTSSGSLFYIARDTALFFRWNSRLAIKW